MKKKIITFGASNSKTSINKKLAVFAANQLSGTTTQVLDLNDFELPLYSIDLQREIGIPENAIAFHKAIKNSDGIVISLAEYNGLHTAAFKNLWDWTSRIDNMNIWHNKPMLLLATSPSRRPESNVMKVSKQLFPHFGANIIADFQLPSFQHTFLDGEIVDPEFKKQFKDQLEKFQEFLNQT